MKISVVLYFRVHVWGACGRWFESSHPDKTESLQSKDWRLFCFTASFPNVFRSSHRLRAADPVSSTTGERRIIQPSPMKTSVSVVCDSYKVLANGESPLMLRISKEDAALFHIWPLRGFAARLAGILLRGLREFCCGVCGALLRRAVRVLPVGVKRVAGWRNPKFILSA